MRQIHVCAWLLMIFAACSGEQFVSTESSGNLAGSAPSAGSASRSQVGAASGAEDSTGGKDAGAAPAPSSAGLAGSAGTSAGGGSPPPGTPIGIPATSECAGGSVTFKMLPSSELGRDYLCDAGCGTGWLSITDAAGATAYSLFSACGTASCETCEVQACAASACLPEPLTAAGSELRWDGSYVTKDTCGANMACQKPACVRPGKYRAKACAAVNGGNSGSGPGCMPKTEMLCAEQEFEYPQDGEVKLVLKR